MCVCVCVCVCVYKSFLVCLIKDIRKKKEEMEKLENKIIKMEALTMMWNMMWKKWNKLDKSKNHHIVQLFLNMDAHGALEKNHNTWAFLFFRKFQDNSDMHVDSKK